VIEENHRWDSSAEDWKGHWAVTGDHWPSVSQLHGGINE
jgi:hypothetical protein